LDLFVDILIILVGILMAYSGWLFTTRRGDVEASGFIGTTRNLAVSTGFPWLETLGHMAALQFSMVLGGVIITLAALSKFLERLSALWSGEA
jgi:TRAP-type C4-dicarboxylate transport system permease small subunit